MVNNQDVKLDLKIRKNNISLSRIGSLSAFRNLETIAGLHGLKMVRCSRKNLRLKIEKDLEPSWESHWLCVPYSVKWRRW